jgi:hypothetical protein
MPDSDVKLILGIYIFMALFGLGSMVAFFLSR